VTSRKLAAKYNICYKTVQKIWNRIIWTKVTDRAPVEGHLAAISQTIDTGTTADPTADALSQAEAGADPDYSPLYPPSVIVPPPASSILSSHLPPLSSSNATTHGSSHPSLEIEAGMNPCHSLLSHPSSLSFPPLASHLSHYVPLPSSTTVSQDSSLLGHTDMQAGGDITHYDTAPLNSWAASDWMPEDSRAIRGMPTGGRQRQVDLACLHCKTRKLKCDGQHPCGRCSNMGIASECVFDTDNRNALLPSVVVHEAGARARNTPTPEHPIPYPSGPVTGVSFVVPHVGSDSPLPLSMVRMFKGVRLADSVYERLLNTITPKLRSTIFRIFRAVDCALVATKPPPAAPREWTENSWNNSLRCGMMTLRLDSSADVYTGVDANPFWTGLAGLHKEEFVNRAFNGEMPFPTSELRQAAKLLMGTKNIIQLKLSGALEPGQEAVTLRPIYGRFSRNWGKGGLSDGMLVRTTSSASNAEPDGSWIHIRTSLVVVTPEEFESVRAQDPDLCEGYLIPVVGSKSAAELMDPRLLLEESFAHMNSCAEGRHKLDRLADVLAQEFSFIFDFLAQHNLPWPAAP